MNEMNNTSKLTQGKILVPLMKFTLPIMAALILQTLYGAVDLLVVGQFAAPAAVSAVMITFRVVTPNIAMKRTRMHTFRILSTVLRTFFMRGSSPFIQLSAGKPFEACPHIFSGKDGRSIREQHPWKSGSACRHRSLRKHMRCS